MSRVSHVIKFVSCVCNHVTSVLISLLSVGMRSTFKLGFLVVGRMSNYFQLETILIW